MAERTLDVPRTRRAIERRLDELVRNNRFTIAVLFPAVGAVTLVGSAEGLVPPPLSFNPLLLLIGVAVMRLPLIAGLAPLFDRTASVAVGGLVAYAYLIEYVGVHTGWPYGEFAYGVNLGPMVAGVPVGLPLFFVPLVADAYLLAVLLLGEYGRSRAARVGATLALVVGIDLVLDPGAVAVGFWSYAGGGPYYGVPWANYAGWVLSGAVGSVAMDVAFDREALLARLDTCEFALDDLVSFVVLWGAIDAVYGNWIAVLIAGGFAAGLFATDRFDFPTLRSGQLGDAFGR